MIKITNKARIAQFIWEEKEVSKQDIYKYLSISMPTVLQNVNELMVNGIIKEAGEYKSTGGRKAKAIVINEEKKYAAGIDITQNHVSFVIINLRGDIILHERKRKIYEDKYLYYEEVSQILEDFLEKADIERKKLLGVGVSLPGILDGNYTELVRSHALKIRNLNLDLIRNSFSYPVEFENDANSALLSELRGDLKNAVYLSLSNTVGGALCIDGRLYMGDNSRAGEIGHMIIEKDGRKCYCGKKGCIDAYCAAHILSSETNDNLNLFFERLNAGDSRLKKIWNEYLEYLVIAITNLRMFYDCDIILGGYVGANLDKYLHVLLQKTKDYNLFDNQVSYIKTCKSKTEASALGIAISFLKKYLLNL